MSTDETLPPLPARLQNIVEDFALCEGKEKLELLLQFSEQLPPLPERLSAHKDQMEPVPECMSPVFAHAEVEAGRFQFFLDVPAEAPTVRGFAAILSLGLAGATPQQILTCRSGFISRWACRPCSAVNASTACAPSWRVSSSMRGRH